MPRVTDFSVGRQWYCDRTKGSNPSQLPPFTFIILGKGPKDNHKFCYTWVHPDCRNQDDPIYNGHSESTHNQCAWFDHQHLKRHGRLLEALLDPLGFDLGGVHYTTELMAENDIACTTRFRITAEGILVEEGSFNFRFREGMLLPDSTRAKINEVEALQVWLEHMFGEPIKLPILQNDFIAGPRGD